MKTEETLYQIDVGHGVFGIVVVNGKVKQAAPMANWTIGKNSSYVLDYYKSKNAKIICMTKVEEL